MARTTIILILSVVLLPLQIVFADNTNAGTATLPKPSSGKSAKSDSASIVGKWRWYDAQVVVINADGTFVATETSRGSWKRHGTWKETPNKKYALLWDDGAWKDELTLSSDGDSLRGRNNRRSKISAERIKD